jgi:3-oxoadipate enol-lactonase
MPTLRVNGAELYCEDTGSGAQAIVFAHGLLCDGRMFEHQVASLRDRYRCVAFDFRGQGRSEITPAGYDIDNVTTDARALIDALNLAPCHFLGLSMGGFVGMRLASRHPQLIRSLMLLSTSADEEPREKLFRYKVMSFVARWISMRLVAGRLKDVMFGPRFQTDPARQAEREEWRRRLLTNSPIGAIRAAKGVFSRPPIYEEIGGIRAPTLIIVGERDTATPPEKARRIHERIPHSRLMVIPEAGHTCTIEEPAAVNAALNDFLGALRRDP